MDLNDLRETIINTHDEFWHQLIVGPFYHDSIYVEGYGYSGTSHSHSHRAVLRSDVNISLEWGLDHGDDEDGDYPWGSFPDKNVNTVFVDIFYAGALVDRRVAYKVDGSRAILPNFTAVRTDSGKPYELEGAIWENQVTRWDYLLAQLLNQLEGRGHSDFESYFARSGLVRTKQV